MTTYPAFFFLLAFIAAVASVTVLPAAILGVIGFSILGVLDVWKEKVND